MAWPDFLLIGAAKSGTTALFHYLKQHPAIFASSVREPNFFALDGPPAFMGPGDDATVNRNSVASVDKYCALFGGAAAGQLAGEVSPLYLYSESAPGRIHAAIPEARLIAILRNPVERAYASFLHLVRDGREPCVRFEEGLEREQERIAANWEHLWHYTSMGFYSRQLTRYLALIDPSRIHILLYDDFQTDPLEAIRSCFRFLEISEEFVPDMRRRLNRSGVPKYPLIQRGMASAGPVRRIMSKLVPEGIRGPIVSRIQQWNLKRPPLERPLRVRLSKLYAEEISALETILKKDLSHWR